MPIKFEDGSPYDLPVAQSAEARSEGEIVELILRVSVPSIQSTPIPVVVPMTWRVAQQLGAQLGPVALAAERRARN